MFHWQVSRSCTEPVKTQRNSQKNQWLRRSLNVEIRGVCFPMASLDTRTARRVLRHRRSRAYFKEGAWTANIDEATEFPSVRQIAETCVRYRLREVDLIMSSEAGFMKITVRLG